MAPYRMEKAKLARRCTQSLRDLLLGYRSLLEDALREADSPRRVLVEEKRWTIAGLGPSTRLSWDNVVSVARSIAEG